MSENEKHNMVIGPEAEAKARAHREKLFREEAETLARRVKTSATVDENADAVTFGGQAGSSASVRIFLEEFSAAGAFLDGVAGTPTIVYDDRESGLGANVRFDELHNVRLSSVFPVVAGRFYR